MLAANQGLARGGSSFLGRPRFDTGVGAAMVAVETDGFAFGGLPFDDGAEATRLALEPEGHIGPQCRSPHNRHFGASMRDIYETIMRQGQ